MLADDPVTLAPVRRLCTVRVGLAFAVLSTVASASPVEDREKAQAHFRRQEWKEVAEIYDRLLKTNPYRAADWSNYGYALHSLKRFDEARAALQKAIELGQNPAGNSYNIACGYAVQGDKSRAFEWLERALTLGFSEANTLADDHEIDSLRSDPRFAKLTGVGRPKELSREEAWRYDLDVLGRRGLQLHYYLSRGQGRERFLQSIGDLKKRVDKLKDHEIVVETERLMASIGDGHTFLAPLRDGRYAFHAYPVVYYLFSDGLFVTGADSNHEKLLGGRVVRLGITTVEEAMERVTPLVSRDNPMGIKQHGPHWLRCAEVLDTLGIAESTDAVDIVVEKSPGEIVRQTLRAGAFGHGRELTRADASSKNPIPLYEKRPDENFWFEHLGNHRLVYFQFNAVNDTPHESVAEFTQKLFSFIDENDVDALVIDLRRNSGGNNALNRLLVHALIRCEKVNRLGHLFVIIGRTTFSAALNGLVDIERNARPIIVGEPSGSRPNCVGETTMVTLPYSGLTVSFASLYWQSSTAMDQRTWVAPHLVAELSSSDYLNRRDPAMDAILGYLGSRDEGTPAPDARP